MRWKCGCGGNRAEVAGHGLGDERGDIVGADLADREFELVGAGEIALGTGAIGAAAIRVARRDVFGGRQDRRRTGGVAPRFLRTSAAIVAPWNDERRPITRWREPFPRSRWYWIAIFTALSVASDPPETNQTLPNPSGANSSMMMRAQLHRLGREGVCRGVGQARGLVGERVDHLRHAVTDRGHRPTTAGVDVRFPSSS